VAAAVAAAAAATLALPLTFMGEKALMVAAVTKQARRGQLVWCGVVWCGCLVVA